jgi:hypothetical protein
VKSIIMPPADDSSNINWDEVVKKEARGIDYTEYIKKLA